MEHNTSPQADPRGNIRTIRQAVEILHRALGVPHIFVGGASLIMMNSTRMTADVDVFIPEALDLQQWYKQLAQPSFFSVEGGVLVIVLPNHSPIKVDFLTELPGKQSFKDVKARGTAVADGIILPALDESLMIKIRSHYLRPENADDKRKTDVEDITFLVHLMKGQGITISNEVASTYQIGHYELLSIRQELAVETVELLGWVGIRRCLHAWEDETQDQQDYYLCFAEARSDPLTTAIQS